MFCSKDYYRPSTYNCDTKNQLWMSIIADSHDNFCECKTPFAHLLANIFPIGHTDRDKTINYILRRDYIELCRSSGGAERDGTTLALAFKEGEGHGESQEKGFIPDALLAEIREEKDAEEGTR